jgi:hypothetical protein
VPLLPLDQVVVIDDAATALQITVVTGTHAGVHGWVPRSWLRPVETETPGNGRPRNPSVAAGVVRGSRSPASPLGTAP